MQFTKKENTKMGTLFFNSSQMKRIMQLEMVIFSSINKLRTYSRINHIVQGVTEKIVLGKYLTFFVLLWFC